MNGGLPFIRRIDLSGKSHDETAPATVTIIVKPGSGEGFLMLDSGILSVSLCHVQELAALAQLLLEANQVATAPVAEAAQ